MTNSTPGHEIPAKISTKLDLLRLYIRTYIWIEGLALAVIWLGLLFWIGLMIDYGPVILFGASEMPYTARVVFLVVVGAGLAAILYRYIARRAFVQLRGKSMAVLLERKHSQFHDSLVTVIETADRGTSDHLFSEEMLDHTYHDALDQIESVEVGRVFNFRPVIISMVGACVVLLSIGLMALFNGALLRTYIVRMSLGSSLYVRETSIEVVGLYSGGIKIVKVAEGKGITIIVRANNTMTVPQRCRIDYRTADGGRGHVYAEAYDKDEELDEDEGLDEDEALDGFQYYLCEQMPFSGVITDIYFDVRGGDHRIVGYTVDAVKNPKIVDTQLHCEYPEYLVDEQSGAYLPRDIPVTAGTQIPQGTGAILMVTTNKDLDYVTIENIDSGESTEIHFPQQFNEGDEQARLLIESWLTENGSWLTDSPEGRRFYFPIPNIRDTFTLKIMLYDSDGIASSSPHTVIVASIEDNPPTVEAILRGIREEVVTPDARIPFAVRVSDDYDISRAWIALDVEGGASEQIPFSTSLDTEIATMIDLRELRLRDDLPIVLQPGDRIEVVVAAADRFDLPSSSGPHIGMSDSYRFEIVTPDELLRHMDHRELQLRERFEQAIEKMERSRDMLLQVRPGNSTGASLVEPGDESEPGDTEDGPENAEQNRRNRRLARLKQSIQNGRQISEEVYGIAIGFEEIGEEIQNNRIFDASERIERLQSRISDPLIQIATVMFTEWDDLLAVVERKFESPDFSDSDVADSLAQADEIVIEMDRILTQMLDLEDFNELVEILRELIDHQERLIDDTRDEQNSQTLDLLQ